MFTPTSPSASTDPAHEQLCCAEAVSDALPRLECTHCVYTAMQTLAGELV